MTPTATGTGPRRLESKVKVKASTGAPRSRVCGFPFCPYISSLFIQHGTFSQILNSRSAKKSTNRIRIPNSSSMEATAGFYSVPGVDRTTSEGEAFSYIWKARWSLQLNQAWAGEQLAGLDGRHPEELPPCFAALQAGAKLSPVTGWETEHGTWEPKKMHAAGPGLPDLTLSFFGWTRTTLVFRPKDGSQSDLAMTMYTAINWINSTAYLEEEMTFCHVYRLPKKNKTEAEEFAVSYWRTLFGHEPLDVAPKRRGNGVGGPKKRPRSKPIGGTLENEKPVGGTLENEKPVDETGSWIWPHFTRIYTKDPKVVFAACHICGTMLKLKGGSGCGTSSPLKHYKGCAFKPRRSTNTPLSEANAVAELELVMLGQLDVVPQEGLMPC